MKLYTKITLFIIFPLITFSGIRFQHIFKSQEDALWFEAARASDDNYCSSCVNVILWLGAKPDKIIDKYGVSPVQQAVSSLNYTLVNHLLEGQSNELRQNACDYAMKHRKLNDEYFLSKLCEDLHSSIE